MIAGVADTHAALWYLLGNPRLSETARRFMDDSAGGYDSIREELRPAMKAATRAGLMKASGDGTFRITDAGTEWFETLPLSPATPLH